MPLGIGASCMCGLAQARRWRRTGMRLGAQATGDHGDCIRVELRCLGTNDGGFTIGSRTLPSRLGEKMSTSVAGGFRS